MLLIETMNGKRRNTGSRISCVSRYRAEDEVQAILCKSLDVQHDSANAVISLS